MTFNTMLSITGISKYGEALGDVYNKRFGKALGNVLEGVARTWLCAVVAGIAIQTLHKSSVHSDNHLAPAFKIRDPLENPLGPVNDFCAELNRQISGYVDAYPPVQCFKRVFSDVSNEVFKGIVSKPAEAAAHIVQFCRTVENFEYDSRGQSSREVYAKCIQGLFDQGGQVLERLTH